MKKIFGGKKASIAAMLTIGMVVLGAGGVYWYQGWLQKPENVFNRMLANNLQVTSLARHSSQEQAGQTLTVDATQVMAPYHTVLAKTSLSQGAGTVIETENMTTTDTNYVRYTNIETDQKRSTGEDFDFSSVLGLWGEAPAANSENSTNQLYSQNVVVPIANLSFTKRKQLLDQIKNEQVYTVDYAAATKQQNNGRQTYTYSVTVAPVGYINMLKTLDNLVGSNQLTNLNPEIYKDTPPLSFAFEIDTLSGQLVKINYQDNNLTETFGSYGVKADVRVPGTTIPLQDLQNRLQQLQ